MSLDVLLLHGLSGSTYDLKFIEKSIKDSGFSVYTPLLKGHGKTAKELETVKFLEWLKPYLNLKPKAILGISMGSLIALWLAKRQPNLKGLVLLSPSLSLNLASEMLGFLLLSNMVSPKGFIPKKNGQSDINDPKARKNCPSLPSIPLKSFKEFLLLRNKALIDLESITCPIFLGFGSLDKAIDMKKSINIIKHTSSSNIVIKEYKNSKHVITLDYDRKILEKDVVRFLLKILV